MLLFNALPCTIGGGKANGSEGSTVKWRVGENGNISHLPLLCYKKPPTLPCYSPSAVTIIPRFESAPKHLIWPSQNNVCCASHYFLQVTTDLLIRSARIQPDISSIYWWRYYAFFYGISTPGNKILHFCLFSFIASFNDAVGRLFRCHLLFYCYFPLQTLFNIFIPVDGIWRVHPWQ